MNFPNLQSAFYFCVVALGAKIPLASKIVVGVVLKHSPVQSIHVLTVSNFDELQAIFF